MLSFNFNFIGTTFVLLKFYNKLISYFCKKGRVRKLNLSNINTFIHSGYSYSGFVLLQINSTRVIDFYLNMREISYSRIFLTLD